MGRRRFFAPLVVKHNEQHGNGLDRVNIGRYGLGYLERLRPPVFAREELFRLVAGFYHSIKRSRLHVVTSEY